MFEARNKIDLIIEVWEKLDCESVGTTELIAIERAVLERFGKAAVDSPMIVARLLADEGAVLRHSEIMELYIERASDRPFDAAFRNILDISGFGPAAASLRRLENLRRKYAGDGNREGLRLLREKTQEGRKDAISRADDQTLDAAARERAAEIAEWLTLWMQSPEMFETWIDVRLSSADFKNRFPDAV